MNHIEVHNVSFFIRILTRAWPTLSTFWRLRAENYKVFNFTIYACGGFRVNFSQLWLFKGKVFLTLKANSQIVVRSTPDLSSSPAVLPPDGKIPLKTNQHIESILLLFKIDWFS